MLTTSQVRKYAQHFIFWRRAIAIPPLHARDVFVVSPNCDLGRLAQDAAQWQRAFPLAPPLPNFLSELSHSPRPYKTFCPSKAHRPLYLRMLAWLMRGGWVTQLCTFAYVVVWPEIMYEVDYEMEAEELAAASAASSASPPTKEAAASSSADESHLRSREASGAVSSPIPVPERASATGTPDVICQGAGDEPSPKTKTTEETAHSPRTGNQAETAGAAATTTEQAAEMARLERIALKAHREAADKATAHARKVIPCATAHPSINDAAHLAGIEAHIILDAKKATGKESRYLAAIAKRLRDDNVRMAWYAMCKYFDGRSALERVALQEDMKRKEAWTLLTAMSEYLLCTRHW